MFINNISYYIMNDPQHLEFGDDLLKNPSPPGSPVKGKASMYLSSPPGTPRPRLPTAKPTKQDLREKAALDSLKSPETKNNYGALGRARGGKRKTIKSNKSKRKSRKSRKTKRKQRKTRRKQRKTRRK